jgi:apolipoprotein N-acyltransferase
MRVLDGATPYTRLGDWVTPCACALLLALALRAARSRRGDV